MRFQNGKSYRRALTRRERERAETFIEEKGMKKRSACSGSRVIKELLRREETKRGSESDGVEKTRGAV